MILRFTNFDYFEVELGIDFEFYDNRGRDGITCYTDLSECGIDKEIRSSETFDDLEIKVFNHLLKDNGYNSFLDYKNALNPDGKYIFYFNWKSRSDFLKLCGKVEDVTKDDVSFIYIGSKTFKEMYKDYFNSLPRIVMARADSKGIDELNDYISKRQADKKDELKEPKAGLKEPDYYCGSNFVAAGNNKWVKSVTDFIEKERWSTENKDSENKKGTMVGCKKSAKSNDNKGKKWTDHEWEFLVTGDNGNMAKVECDGKGGIATTHYATPELSLVNSPEHYNQYSVEVIDMMEQIWGIEKTITWCEMTAFKYRMRMGTKKFNSIEQDLAKEQWYLNKIKELKDKLYPKYEFTWMDDVDKFKN